MNISKDIIRDLLPVYVAGEASADTQELVEQNLAGDSELRAEAANLGSVPLTDIAPPAGLEWASLRRTQRLLGRRSFLVGFGYLFTTLPLALSGRLWGPVWHGVPAIRMLSTASIILAAAGWMAFMRNANALHGTGFEPQRTRGPLLGWGIGCCLAAYSLAVVVNDWFPGHLGAYFCGFLPLTYAFWVMGRRLGQFHSLFELDPPRSLFNRPDDTE
jgi:hypothetical protein